MKKTPFFIDSYTRKIILKYKKLRKKLIEFSKLGLLKDLPLFQQYELYRKHNKLKRKLLKRLTGLGVKVAGAALLLLLNNGEIKAQPFQFQFNQQTGTDNPIDDADNGPQGDPNMRYAIPDFVDIDNDGNFDAFIGWNNGTSSAGIEYWENTGDDENPAFTYNSADNALSSVNYDSNGPAFVDIDKDGDLDVFIYAGDIPSKAASSYTIEYYKNTGDATNPTFALQDAADNPFSTLTNENPTFVDIDNDGDMDCFTGGTDGVTRFYENTSTLPTLNFENPVSNPFGITDDGEDDDFIEFVDIDADGDMDLFIGDGDVTFFENTGDASNPAFTQNDTDNRLPVSVVNYGSFSSLDFVDIDNDGDKDVFIGRESGDVEYFQNDPIDNDPTIWNGTVWDNGPPNSGKNAIVRGDLNVVDNLQSNTLTIDATWEVTVSADKVIIAHGDLTNNGTITLKTGENQSASLIDNGNVSGTGTVKLEIDLSANKYHQVSSPFNLGDVDSDVFTKTYTTPYFNTNFYKYNETDGTADWMNGWVRAYTDQSTADDLEVGRGYSVYFDRDVTAVIEGTHNTDVVNYNVTLTDGLEIDDHEGWNLIGNPYPSKLSIDAFLIENSFSNNRIEGSVRFWNDANGVYSTEDYAYWNLTGEIGSGNPETNGQSSETTKKPTNYIAPGQGFYVKALGDFALEFNNSMRLRGTAGSVFFKSKSNKDPKKIKLGLVGPQGHYNEILVALDERATNDYDIMFDASKIIGNDYIGFYTLLNNKKYGIQTFNDDQDDILTVPLGIFSGVAGEYKFSKVFLKKFENNYKVYLIDNQENRKIDLSKESSYTCILGAETNNTRFELSFEPFNIWQGGFSDNWGDSQNWLKGVPKATDHVLIPSGAYAEIKTTSQECYNLVVDAGGSLAVFEDRNLKVNNDLTLKTKYNEYANLLEYNNITVGGTSDFNKDFSFHMLKLVSVPMNGQNVPDNEIHNFYAYDNEEQEKNWIERFSKEQVNNPVITGKGYVYLGLQNAAFNFSGNSFISGDVEIAVEEKNTGDSRLQLIGNPYPSAIDIEEFIAVNDNTVIDGSLYFINTDRRQKINTVDFAVWNMLGSISGGSEDVPDGTIGVGQGFYVMIAEDNVNSPILFTDDMRIAKKDTEEETSEISKFKISVSNNFNLYNETLIGLSENATDGFDQLYDAYKLKPNQDISLYSKYGDSDFAILALAKAPTEIDEYVIPLGFNTTGEEEFTFNFFDLTNLEECEVYFEDKETGSVLNIKETGKYTFTSSKGLNENRFLIRLNPGDTENPDNLKYHDSGANMHSSDGNIVINLIPDSGYSTVYVYDEKGMLVYEGSINQQEIIIPVTQGFYLVRLQGDEKKHVRKVVSY